MNRSNCQSAIELDTLVEYWLGELEESRQTPFEEHLFGCADCAQRLQGLAGIGDGIRALMRNGNLAGIVTQDFLDGLVAEGLRIREYRVAPGGSVNCTITPEDDVVVSRLSASLAGVTALDLVLFDQAGAELERLRDIQFDAAAGEVIYIPSAALLRTLPVTTMSMQLLATANDAATLIGKYTFNHTPTWFD